MCRHLSRTIFLVLLFLGFTSGLVAQQTATRVKMEGIPLPEGGMAVLDDASPGEVRVVRVLAPQHGSSAPTVDLESGDVIAYVNGRRVRTVEEVHRALDTIKNGEEVKLGIRRGGGSVITAFSKPEVSHSSERHMIQIGPDAAVIEGYLIQHQDGAFRVMQQLPWPQKRVSGLKEGDEVLALNDRNISQIDQLRDGYEAVKTGEKVRLRVRRGGETLNLDSVKPALPPGMIRTRIEH